MADLNEQDSNKLFAEISKAIQEDDSAKLSTLTEEPALDEDKEQLEETPPVDDTPPDDTEDEETSPLDDKPADDNAEDKEDKTPDTPDELATLKEQLEKLNKENHNLRSQAGRVPYVQKRLRELDKKLEELASSQASPSSHPSTKIKPKVDELLKGIRETDADLADAISQAIAQATDGVAEEMRTKERENLTFLRDQEALSYQEAEASRLIEMYPNAADVFRSEHFKKWRESQPSGIQALAASSNADEVSVAFEKYAKDMTAAHPELATKAPITPAANTENTEQAKKIEAERQKRKASSANVSSPSASGKIAIPDDPQALFEKYTKEIQKGIRGE
jgi:ElaB/YqjD/DUF883 family membrane-anchored ribosome-binding protein